MTTQPARRLTVVRDHHPSRPPRRPRNGHHADCPYPHQPAPTCHICNGIRKAAHQEER